MSAADEFLEGVDARGYRKAQADLDKRLPVGVQLKDGQGFVTVEVEDVPRDDSYDWILDHHPAVDRDTHEIDESVPVEIGSWQMGYTVGSGDNREARAHDLHRFKAKVRVRRPGVRLSRSYTEDLCKMVRKRKAVEPVEAAGPWLVVSLADLQLGKGDFGGTPVTLERVGNALDSIAAMVKRLKPAGVAIVDLGDLCEQVSCFYDSQTHTVDLNLTQQIEVATDVMLSAVEAVLKWTARVLVGAVPSNHGEFRVGKATVATDRARDNIDLVIAHNVSRVVAANPERYGHVEVWTPPLTGGDPYVLTLDLDGVMVGFTHGHQVKQMGKGRMAGLEQWWHNHQWTDRKRPKGENLPTIADCDIVVTGHGHTLMISEQTGKLLIQSPAAETGSEYYTTSTGGRSSAGVLTFQVSDRWAMLANHFEMV